MTVVRPNSIAGINSITVQTGQALNVHDASGNLIRSLTNSSGISTYQAVTVTSGDLIVGTSDLFVDNSTGHIGMGTEVPTDTGGYGRALDIKGGSGGAAIYLRTLNGDTGQIALGSADLTIRTRQADPIIFNVNNSERARIDTSGRLLVGSTSNNAIWGVNAALQVEGTSGDTSAINLIRNTNDGGGAMLTFGKSRATSDGGSTVVQSGDVLGHITWVAADGTDLNSSSAAISVEVDGTPGSNDTPGRILFKTTPDGASGVTERMRIRADGIAQFTNAGESLFGTGVTAMNIGNGVNVSMADDASFTMSSACNTGALIAVGTVKDASGNIRYRHGLFFAQYGSSTVTELSDSESTFATSDSDGYLCVYATSSVNGNVVIKNRLGHTSNVCVTIIRFLGN